MKWVCRQAGGEHWALITTRCVVSRQVTCCRKQTRVCDLVQNVNILVIWMGICPIPQFLGAITWLNQDCWLVEKHGYIITIDISDLTQHILLCTHTIALFTFIIPMACTCTHTQQSKYRKVIHGLYVIDRNKGCKNHEYILTPIRFFDDSGRVFPFKVIWRKEYEYLLTVCLADLQMIEFRIKITRRICVMDRS